MEVVEDIILSYDKRNISSLRPYLPPDFCRRAAEKILEHKGNAVLATGFYIKSVDAATETDGPPGTIMLAKALEELGYSTGIITDAEVYHVIKECFDGTIHSFPVYKGSDELNEKAVSDFIKAFKPSIAISIERCGRGNDGKYRNMRGEDISARTFPLDLIFMNSYFPSAAVGDGGNEIGMGNLYNKVLEHGVHHSPSIVKADELVITSVSNWGAYGIVAYLSQMAGRNLFTLTESEIVKTLVEHGAVDGITGRHEMTVDTFPTELGDMVIEELKRAVGLKPVVTKNL